MATCSHFSLERWGKGEGGAPPKGKAASLFNYQLNCSIFFSLKIKPYVAQFRKKEKEKNVQFIKNFFLFFFFVSYFKKIYFCFFSHMFCVDVSPHCVLLILFSLLYLVCYVSHVISFFFLLLRIFISYFKTSIGCRWTLQLLYLKEYVRILYVCFGKHCFALIKNSSIDYNLVLFVALWPAYIHCKIDFFFRLAPSLSNAWYKRWHCLSQHKHLEFFWFNPRIWYGLICQNFGVTIYCKRFYSFFFRFLLHFNYI